MRKIYCFGLLTLLSMTLCGIAAVAQSVTVNNIEYFIQDDGTAKVGNGKSATGDVVIPAEVEYEGKKYPVVAISGDAFARNTAITSVELPASVVRLGRYVFLGCSNRASVTAGAEKFDEMWYAPFERTAWLANLPREDGVVYWKGWIIHAEWGTHDVYRIKEGTVGFAYHDIRISADTLYLPKSYTCTIGDCFSAKKIVVDAENLIMFSDDFGAVYLKNEKWEYYSYTEEKYVDVTGQALLYAPLQNEGVLRIAEGTKYLATNSCNYASFEKLIVPEGCEAVLGNSIRNLYNCKYIELPSTLKYFEMYDPCGDSQMEIVLKANEVPDTNNDPFGKCKHVTLYVPKESLDKYLADSRYNGKFKEIKAIPDNVTIKGDVNGDGKVNAADVTTVYNYIADSNATSLTLDQVDINGDGKVNATDITDLYNIIQVE